MGGPSAKVCSSAKFCVLVFKASLLDYLGGPSAKVCLSAKFWCTGIQGIYALFIGGPLAKEGSSDKYEHTSKLLLNNFQCNCLQEIHSCLGGQSAKVGSPAKFGVAVFKASILDSLGVHQPKYVHLPSFV